MIGARRSGHNKQTHNDIHLQYFGGFPRVMDQHLTGPGDASWLTQENMKHSVTTESGLIPENELFAGSRFGAIVLPVDRMVMALINVSGSIQIVFLLDTGTIKFLVLPAREGFSLVYFQDQVVVLGGYLLYMRFFTIGLYHESSVFHPIHIRMGQRRCVTMCMHRYLYSGYNDIATLVSSGAATTNTTGNTPNRNQIVQLL